MKKITLLSSVFLACLMLVSSCKKDDPTSDGGVAQGTMTTAVDGKNLTFSNITGIFYKNIPGTQAYEYLAVTGISGINPAAADYSSFIITVYGEKLAAKKYEVPAYDETIAYDYLKGFSMGYYIQGGSGNQIVYASLYKKNATGYVTIESISSTSAKGTYDMTLSNTTDVTKTIKLTGSFNAKVYSFGGK